MKYLKYFVCLIIFFGCKQNDANEEAPDETTNSSSVQKSETKTYTDGTWCADVEYYNPNTGARPTYTLNVEVENGELTKIEWPNGGWLDESHFTPEDITSGECSFDSDKGYTYTVTLETNGWMFLIKNKPV